jgi:hypothetical protein
VSAAIPLWTKGLIDARKNSERPLIGVSLRFWDSFSHLDSDWKIYLSLGERSNVQKYTQEFSGADLYDVMHLTTNFLKKTP